jgi:pseudouridylate synthase
VVGKEVTPFLLDYLHRGTAGESLAANVRLAIRNAALAAEIAAAVARA